MIKVDIPNKGINPTTKSQDDVVQVRGMTTHNVKETNPEAFKGPPIRNGLNLHETESISRIFKRYSSKVIKLLNQELPSMFGKDHFLIFSRKDCAALSIPGVGVVPTLMMAPISVNMSSIRT